MPKPRSATPRIRVDASLTPAAAAGALDQLRADLALAARGGAGRVMLSDARATVPAQQLVLAAMGWAAREGVALSLNPAVAALLASCHAPLSPSVSSGE